ncbi:MULTISPECIES: hypothetical protein [Nocardia]|uniref:Transmembrane protein n=1 Tax=Nocardia aurea TaxID=2144174 RepID=A0ABV3FXX7_9NOCA|nr:MULTISPECIES: hypothetical protein [Nocardia]
MAGAVRYAGRGRHRRESRERELAPHTVVTLALLSLIPVLAAVGPLAASALMLRYRVTSQSPASAHVVAVASAAGLMTLAASAVIVMLAVTARRAHQRVGASAMPVASTSSLS